MSRTLTKPVLWLSLVALLVLLAAPAKLPDLVLYNHSRSVPIGFYVRSSGPIEQGAFVTVRARDVAPVEAHRRRFEDATDRFIKRVAARGGAHICGDGQRVTINTVETFAVLDDDRGSLEGWRGCRFLAEDEVLLLGDTADSFDGRYWGPVRLRLIEGVWLKL